MSQCCQRNNKTLFI